MSNLPMMPLAPAYTHAVTGDPLVGDVGGSALHPVSCLWWRFLFLERFVEKVISSVTLIQKLEHQRENMKKSQMSK